MKTTVLSAIFFSALLISLAFCFQACDKVQGEKIPTAPTALDPNCYNVEAKTVSATPSAYSYAIYTTNTVGGQAKVTILGGIAPFQVTSNSFVAFGKTTGATFSSTNLVLTKDDKSVYSVDPSCTTFVFYLQPVGGPYVAGSYSDTVYVRDSTGSYTTLTITLTVSEPPTS